MYAVEFTLRRCGAAGVSGRVVLRFRFSCPNFTVYVVFLFAAFYGFYFILYFRFLFFYYLSILNWIMVPMFIVLLPLVLSVFWMQSKIRACH